MDNLTFQRTFRSFPNCFTNLSQTFQFVKFICKIFSLSPPVSRSGGCLRSALTIKGATREMSYKLRTFFSICQIFLKLFLDLTFRVSFITCRCQILYKCKNKYSPDKQNQKIFYCINFLIRSISSLIRFSCLILLSVCFPLSKPNAFVVK